MFVIFVVGELDDFCVRCIKASAAVAAAADCCVILMRLATRESASPFIDLNIGELKGSRSEAERYDNGAGNGVDGAISAAGCIAVRCIGVVGTDETITD